MSNSITRIVHRFKHAVATSAPTATNERKPISLTVAGQVAVVGGLMLASGWSATGLAQGVDGARAISTAARQYDIPAGPLGSVLATFASEAGLLMAGSTELVMGHSSPGLRGAYTVPSAFDALLAGTGLVVERQPNGTHALRQATPPKAARKPTTSASNIKSEQVALPAIMVKGEKIVRSIQDTASSVTPLSADDLANKKGVATIAEAIVDVPNVLYTSTVGAPIIRGQDSQGPNFGSTAFFGGTIPRATINLDGHYLNYWEYVFGGTGTWDVDSIEIFRGPQTTSQGANAIAGAIIVKTKEPTFKPEASYLAEVGSYDRKRGAFVVSGPLVDNELAGRLSIDVWRRDTFIDFVGRSFVKGDSDQDFRSLNAYGKLLWTPGGMPGLMAKLAYAHNSANRPTWESASEPYDELRSTTASMPSWKQDTDTGILDIEYEVNDRFRLVNQTQHSKSHVDRVITPANNGSAVVKQKNSSNETRLSFGEPGAAVTGVVGLYLARTTSDDTLNIRGISHFNDKKKNLGLFAESSNRLTERWTLTGGLRYQRDQIERKGISPGFAPNVPLDYDKTFDAWLPKLALAYAATPAVTVGAQISKGYNPGGVNLSFARRRYITFDAETVMNYELFGRAKLLNDRMMLSANLFRSDYRNSQRLLPDYLNGTQYGAVAVNADKAKAHGLELGMNILVRDDLQLKAGIGLLDTEIGGFADAGGSALEGKEFGGSPAYMAHLGIDWSITPGVKTTAEVRHTDGYHSTDENKPAYVVGANTVANLRIAYAYAKGQEIYGFVNNAFDRRSATYLYDDRSGGGIVANVLEPRVIGVGLKGSF